MKTNNLELSTLSGEKRINSKYYIAIIFFILTFNTTFGQSDVVYQKNTITTSEVDSTSKTSDNNDYSEKVFFDKYNIDTAKTYYGKLLNRAIIRLDASCDAENLQEEIPAGEVVLVYKFINNEGGCYAIKYKDHLGFVKSSTIMPVQVNTSTSVNTSEYDTPPELITYIRPKYPKEARKNKIKGSVLLKVLINKKGLVEDAEIVKGVEGLNQSAIDAVKKAKFKPAQYKGKSVPARITLSIDFE